MRDVVFSLIYVLIGAAMWLSMTNGPALVALTVVLIIIVWVDYVQDYDDHRR